MQPHTLHDSIFIAACIIVMAASIYLIVTRCYQTGLPGSIALGAKGTVAASYLGELCAAEGTRYELLPQNWWLMIALAVWLTQHCYRVIVSVYYQRRKRPIPFICHQEQQHEPETATRFLRG